MQLKHIEEVARIERIVYPNPWAIHTFANEITGNKLAYYIVARINEEIIGYAGMWLILDEAHITNLAVHPKHRRRRIGEVLLTSLIDEAMRRNLRWMTLEVREKNSSAQNLYKKYNFKIVGKRSGYYLDSGESALIMWSDNLQSKDFKEMFRKLKENLLVYKKFVKI
jgi:ribosomal-protein-alanine N-acetyltransferase